MTKLVLTVVAVLALLSAASAAVPAGFTTYFGGDACPTGWSELPDAQGRLVVSVVDADNVGLTVGTALTDKQDPVHTHPISASVDLPSQHVAADGCCNDQAAGAGTYESNAGDSDAASSELPFTQLLLCRLDAATDYDVPFGAVAYFDSTVDSCPKDWKPYNTAAGRTLVPGYAAVDGPTKSAAEPLESQEDRKHQHTFTGTISTDSVSFAGIDDCCNDSPAKSGDYSAPGTAEAASSNIPYIQMLTCVNMNETFAVSLPDNALLWTPLVGCPKGWELASTVSGRFLVALPQNGEAGASFGGTSMGSTASSEAQHTHNVNGTITAHDTGIGLASGCCAGGYAAATEYQFVTVTTKDDIELPWLMITLCQESV